jgi:hypothetical protein
VVLATGKATAGGQVAASFAVPSGFAGSHYPGRKDTFIPGGVPLMVEKRAGAGSR